MAAKARMEYLECLLASEYMFTYNWFELLYSFHILLTYHHPAINLREDPPQSALARYVVYCDKSPVMVDVCRSWR